MQKSTEQQLLRIRCEKVIRVRRGIRRKDGRFFTQREFAKLIGYPIARYAEAEKKDEAVDNFLLEKLIMICHANPYYLYDDSCTPWEGEYTGNAVDQREAPAILTTYDTILKWIQLSKPRTVSWTDEWEESKPGKKDRDNPKLATGLSRKGLKDAMEEFCMNTWTFTWENEAFWSKSGDSVNCHAKAMITTKVTDKDRFTDAIQSMMTKKPVIHPETIRINQYGENIFLPKNPGNTDISIFEFLEGQLSVVLDNDLVDYVTEDKYYSPVMEDYHISLEITAKDFLSIFGIEILESNCEAEQSDM